MAESEFEDAASELLEGGWKLGRVRKQATRSLFGKRRTEVRCGNSVPNLLVSLPAGAQSPTGLGSAQPAPLPLQLGSREHDSQLLLLLHAASPPRGAAAAAAAARADAQSTAGSPGSAAGGLAAERFDGEDGGQQRDEGRTVIAAQLQLQAAQHAVVTINTLALRAHAAGWEEAAQCLHTYAVLAEQAQRQYATASEARAASPWGHQQGGGGGVQPAAARASDTAAPPGALALRLHLRSLLLEAVADGEGSFGGPGLVPALTLQAQVQLEADRGADGASRLQLAVPGLLLAVGTVASAGAAPGDGGGCNAGPPATLALPLQDSLLGLRGLELSLVSQQQRRHSQPAATTADGSVQLGDAHQVSVGATLAQASVWAYPRNLCAAAALAGHAQVLAAGVAAQLPLGELDGGMGDKVRRKNQKCRVWRRACSATRLRLGRRACRRVPLRVLCGRTGPFICVRMCCRRSHLALQAPPLRRRGSSPQK